MIYIVAYMLYKIYDHTFSTMSFVPDVCSEQHLGFDKMTRISSSAFGDF